MKCSPGNWNITIVTYKLQKPKPPQFIWPKMANVIKYQNLIIIFQLLLYSKDLSVDWRQLHTGDKNNFSGILLSELNVNAAISYAKASMAMFMRNTEKPSVKGRLGPFSSTAHLFLMQFHWGVENIRLSRRLWGSCPAYNSNPSHLLN